MTLNSLGNYVLFGFVRERVQLSQKNPKFLKASQSNSIIIRIIPVSELVYQILLHLFLRLGLNQERNAPGNEG